ncbi:conserved hypothetical protein [Pediculus humanus corporis]|uniref:Uncharacterized protein n=1 Tax=Pediculus humanus subsp. corporis TaxID=121224 RepID=E0VNQ6_PEDHC|nr:uncharacterized protein Phum_PHUM339780 [Pediculus humanus corporis]EEB15012.1 conserved hypothetical protein [Pediculus humanus corporis]
MQSQLRYYHNTRFFNNRQRSRGNKNVGVVNVGGESNNDLKELRKSEYFSKEGEKYKLEKSMKIIQILKHRAKNIEKSLRDPWKSKMNAKCPYKVLRNTAKQKFRSFNAQKKVPAIMIVPKMVSGKKTGNKNYCKSIVMPATAANFLSYAKNSNNIINTNYDSDNNNNNNNDDLNDEFNGNTFDEDNNNNNIINGYGEDDEEEMEGGGDFDGNKSLILSENSENCLYKQLNDLKKENEELKKKIIEIMERKGLKDDLQMNTDHLELEKTKLKACWLIMSSTLDAFSNFCKKLRTKQTNDGKMNGEDCCMKTSKNKSDVVADGYVINNTNNNNNKMNYCKGKNGNGCCSNDFEEVLDAAAYDKDDKKYYSFLKKLILDQVENEKERNRIAKLEG